MASVGRTRTNPTTNALTISEAHIWQLVRRLKSKSLTYAIFTRAKYLQKIYVSFQESAADTLQKLNIVWHSWTTSTELVWKIFILNIYNFKNAATLKTGVQQGHWKCHHSIERAYDFLLTFYNSISCRLNIQCGKMSWPWNPGQRSLKVIESAWYHSIHRVFPISVL